MGDGSKPSEAWIGNAIGTSITLAPDALVKKLWDVHGWPAYESLALCAVKQLQQEVLDDSAEQALGR